MRKSRNFWIVIPILLGFVLLVLSLPVCTLAAPKKIEWVMATVSPQGHYLSQRYLVPFANKVRETSGDRLDIKMFYIGHLPHNGADYLRVVKERNLDAALVGLREAVGDIPVTGVFNLPFFFTNVEVMLSKT